MTVKDLEQLHSLMENALSCEKKYIDKIYFCPHLETSNCDCRKPRIGMFMKAKLDFPEININGSFLVGDSDSDILAGRDFGLETVKVSNSFTLYDWLTELSQ
jgi:D-glycero-D-manno-heptose 1,7-bisphosphate phosphatase